MICALIVVGGIGLSTVRETLLNDRKVEISEIINSSVAVAKGFQGRVDAGDISQPEAQSAFYNA